MNAADVELDEFLAFKGGHSALSSPDLSALGPVGSASSSTSNLGTVSPQDLLVQEPLSAPSSTAMTALTSPSLCHGSPDLDCLDVSPGFEGTDLGSGGDSWYPLFPPAESGGVEKALSDGANSQAPEDLDASESLGKKSASPSTNGARPSVPVGVNARKRSQPLPPIIVEDPNDTVAMKRARNTLAARKSRERKAQRFELLEKQIKKLEEERDYWKRLALARS